MRTGISRSEGALAARAKSHHSLWVRGHGRKARRRATHVSGWWHHTRRWAWGSTRREALPFAHRRSVAGHWHHTWGEIEGSAVWSWDSRVGAHRAEPVALLWGRLTGPSGRRQVFQARRSLQWHRRLIWWAGTTRSHGALAALGERNFIKVAHRRAVGASSAELLVIRPLHIGNGRIVKEVWSLLASQSRGRTRHHLRHQAWRRSWSSIRGPLRDTTLRSGANLNLLHQSKKMLTLARVGFLPGHLGQGILLGWTSKVRMTHVFSDWGGHVHGRTSMIRMDHR